MKNILVKDKDGKLKILRNGKLIDPQDKSALGSQGAVMKSDEDLKLKKEVQQFEDVSKRQMNTEVVGYIEKQAQDILKKNNISLSDEGKQRHLVSLLVTSLRGVRNSFDTKQMLSRSVKDGGFGLDENQVSLIMTEVDKVAQDVPQKQKMMKKIITQSQGSDNQVVTKDKEQKTGIQKLRSSYEQESYTIHDTLKQKSSTSENKIADNTPPITLQEKREQDQTKVGVLTEKENKNEGDNGKANELQKTKPSKVVPQGKQVIQKSQVGRKKANLQTQTVHLKPPANPVLVKETADGTSMVDVVHPQKARAGYSGVQAQGSGTVDTRSQKLVGPIDELALMNLVDFRRISESLDQRMDKLLEKIQLLEERSYIDRIKGIQAWQASEVYSLYVEMGYTSLVEGKTLQEVISEREDSQQQVLTEKEFFAISNLNKQLNF